MAKKREPRRVFHTVRESRPIDEAFRDGESMAEWKRSVEFDPLRDVEAWALEQASELGIDFDAWKESLARLGTDPDSLHPDIARSNRLFHVSRQLQRLDVDDPEPIRDLARLMEQLAWGWIAHKSENKSFLMQNLFRAGQTFERLHTWRPLEHLTEMGGRVASGHQSSGDRVRVPKEETTRRGIEWQELVDAERRRDPHISYTKATDRVAANLTAKGQSVSGRTIRRHTKDVLPYVD